MLRIFPDVGRNRLIIQLAGRPSLEMCTEGMAHLNESLERLRAPIDVLIDVVEFEGLDDAALECARLAEEALLRFGVRKSVRLFGRSTQAAVVQMHQSSRPATNEVSHLAFSIREAELLFSRADSEAALVEAVPHVEDLTVQP
ncbi:MAG: hypothetical protein ACOZQL_32450 [Myxococcota bacterium]